MWGAVLSGGMQLASGIMGMGAADSQNQLAWQEYYAQQDQRRQDNNYRTMMMNQGWEALQRERELQDYYMQINDQNQALVRDQLEYSRDWVQQNRDFLVAEQEYEKYRIGEGDRMAAQERARQLEKLINDEGITQAERDRALEELNYTRSVAAGERDFDVRQYEADQLQNQLEYQYRAREYERMLGMATDERDHVIQRQQEILDKAGLMDQEIQAMMASFGDVEPAKRYSEADVTRAEKEFYADYLADADRAADRLASVNEADLIRSGVDTSSTGDSSRRELLQEQLVPLYNKARINARNDALSYITGLQNNEIAAAQSEIDARASAMEEIMKGNGALLEVMQSLPNAPSAMSRDYLQLGSGVLDPRNLTSAGDYNSPLRVGSGVLDRDLSALAQLGMMQQWGTPTSAASIDPSTYTGDFDPINLMGSNSNYMSNALAMNPMGSNNMQFFAKNAAEAASGGMQNLKSGANNLFEAFSQQQSDPYSSFNFSSPYSGLTRPGTSMATGWTDNLGYGVG